MENLNSKGKLVFGSVLAGVAIGVTSGVLFAPRKGKKTRKNISNTVKNSMSKFKQEMNEDEQFLKDKAMQFENVLGDKIHKAGSSFKEKANELLQSGSNPEMNKK